MKTLLAVLLFFAAIPAYSEVTTYRAEGTVDYSAWDQVQVGESFSYEATIDDQAPYTDGNRYLAISNVKATFGRFVMAIPSLTELAVTPSFLAAEWATSGIIHYANLGFVPVAAFADNSIANAADLDTKAWSYKGFGISLYDQAKHSFVDASGQVRTLARKWANGWGIGKEPALGNLQGLPDFNTGGRVC